VREPGKPPTRRQLAAEETRCKILATALDQFSRHPFGEVTVGGIARSAGVAHGLLSHHFQGKDGLYAEVLQEAIRQLRKARQSDPDAPPHIRVRQRIHAHLAYLAKHPKLALNLVLAGPNGTTGAHEVFESERRQRNRRLCELLGLPPDEPALQLSIRSFTAAVDDLTTKWLRQGQPFDIDRVTDASMDLLTGAVRAAHTLNPELDVTGALSLLAGKKPVRRRPRL
jgi:AcrR family transcriptional regulator